MIVEESCMSRYYRPLLPAVLIGLVLLVSSQVLATDLGNRADAAAQAQMEAQKLVGLGVGLVIDGEVAHLAGYGFADREAGIKVDPRKTMFRWASISKPLTAVAAVQLWEAGKLDLDQPVRDLVPEFPDKGQPITIRQLLGHLGGIVHYSNGKLIKSKVKYEQENPYSDVIVALDMFKESPLVNTPGEEFAYSTHGFILASAVIQRAGNMAFHQQVHDGIAEPLGMKTLRPDYQWEDIPDRAVGYRKPKKESTDTDVSWKLAGGGFISTVEDLLLFASGLLEGKLVSPGGYELMWTPQTKADGTATTYGLGFGIGGEGLDYQIVHTGSQEKTRTLMVVFPKQNSAMVIMTNSEYADIGELAEALAPLLRQEETVSAP
jgi:serine beta-lactamase-like protein LACTB